MTCGTVARQGVPYCWIYGDWSKITVRDSENNSADLYAHLGHYNVLQLEGKYATH